MQQSHVSVRQKQSALVLSIVNNNA